MPMFLVIAAAALRAPLIVHPVLTSRLAVARAPLPLAAMSTTLALPRVSIQYCTGCNWMLRSAWMAQELLTTFNGTIGEVALVPIHDVGGTFEVVVTTESGDDFLVWSRAEEERFPESKELKQRVRDVIAPERSLGHSDTTDDTDDSPTKGTGRTAVQRLLDLLRGGGDRRTAAAEAESAGSE